MVKTQRVVITPGEPAGIGPDLVVQLAQREWPVELVVCADATLLTNRAAMLGLPLTLRPYSPNSPAQPQTAGTLTLLPVALRAPVTAGQLAVENGHYVVETLARACDGCLNGEFAALITGPVHKGVINDAGIPFTGHTEFFEERSQAKKVVMMLATEELRVALATTHLPLRDIADAITPALLHEVIAILHHDLRTKFGIAEPRILVCGLNPHAGEGGHMGTEEIDTIIPVLNELRAQGMKLNGPLPADTLFQPKYLDNADAVLAVYPFTPQPTISSSVAQEFFGPAHYGQNLSIINLNIMLGSFASTIAGSIETASGSYAGAFWLFTGLEVISLLLFAVLGRTREIEY